MPEALFARVRRVVADTFGVAPERVELQSTPDTLPEWESLSHVHLIMAIEAEFGIRLAPEDAATMLSVERILEIVNRGGAHG